MISVVIPTYNRVKELSTLLDSILLEKGMLKPGDVDIVISDNCSSDGTSLMVSQFKAAHPDLTISYFRNPENLGFSRNVDLSVRRSQSEYALIMSDDDAFEKGALRTIIGALETHKDLDALVVSSNTYDATLQNVTVEVADRGVRFYPDGCDYLCKCKGFPPALVSGCLFRVSSWRASVPEEYLHSISVHMLVLTEMLLGHASLVEISKPLIKYRSGQSNCTWTKDNLFPFRFYLDSLLACKRYRPLASKKIFRYLYRVPTRTIAFYVLRQRVLRHPFDAKAFDEYYGRAMGPMNIYTVLVRIFRILPRTLLLPLYKFLAR